MTLSPERVCAAEEICCGEREAVNFCLAFIEWCHWLDDLIDKDKVWTGADVVRANLNALLAFSDNEFFQRHKFKLMPMIVTAAGAFADSVQWEKREGVQDRRAADILKSQYHEVVWQIAYLCGGWDHMRAVTKKFRAFDYDFKG